MNSEFSIKKEWWIGGCIILAAVFVSWAIISEPYSKWFGPQVNRGWGEPIVDDVDYVPPQPYEDVPAEPVTFEEIVASSTIFTAHLLLKDRSHVYFETSLKDGTGTALLCGTSYEYADFPGGYFHPPYGSSEGCEEGEQTLSLDKITLDLETLEVGQVEMSDGSGSDERYPYRNTAVAGVLAITRGGDTERFFLLFGTHRYDGLSVFSESFGEPLHDLIVDNITFEDGVYVVLDAHSPAGQQISMPFLIDRPARNADAPRIVKLTPDRKSKTYEDHALSFLYPLSFSTQHKLWYGRSRYKDYRLGEMEETTGKSPIYYSGACGQEPALADMTFGFYDGVSSRTLGVHYLSSPTVHLTTAPYGYDPTEWGKIIGTLDMATYAAWVQDGVKIPGKNMEILEIGGYTVRRIIHEQQPRPCYDVLSDQYQWIQDGVLLNMISSSREPGVPINDETDQAFVRQIIESLEVK